MKKKKVLLILALILLFSFVFTFINHTDDIIVLKQTNVSIQGYKCDVKPTISGESITVCKKIEQINKNN